MKVPETPGSSNSIQITSPQLDILLSSLLYQGTSNDCGPYTAATIINALLGLNVEASILARDMDKPIWRGIFPKIRRIPRWATFPWGIVDVLNQYGLSASWQLMGKTQDILNHLPDGTIYLPILANWKPLWAHIMILVAFDSQQGWGFANTQYPNKQIFWLPNYTFESQWRNTIRMIVRVDHR